MLWSPKRRVEEALKCGAQIVLLIVPNKLSTKQIGLVILSMGGKYSGSDMFHKVSYQSFSNSYPAILTFNS